MPLSSKITRGRNLALVSVDGQSILALGLGPMQASEIYGQVAASQPTVSRRLGHLLERKVLSLRHAPDDRRCSIYALNPRSMWREVDDGEISALRKLSELLSQGCPPNSGLSDHS